MPAHGGDGSRPSGTLSFALILWRDGGVDGIDDFPGLEGYEVRGDGVSDHEGDFLFGGMERELVIGGERLQEGSFAKRDVPVFVRVEEAAAGWIEASTGDGRGGRVPFHATVDVLEACGVFMALEPQILFPCRSAAAILGSCPDPPHHKRGPFFWTVVPMIRTLAGGREAANCLGHGFYLFLLLREWDHESAASGKHQAFTALRDPESDNVVHFRT